MPESPLPQFTCVGVHERYLLHARMIVTTYNQHVRLLSSEPLVGLRLQSLLGPGSRHCLWESLRSECQKRRKKSACAWFRQLTSSLPIIRTEITCRLRPIPC